MSDWKTTSALVYDGSEAVGILVLEYRQEGRKVVTCRTIPDPTAGDPPAGALTRQRHLGGVMSIGMPIATNDWLEDGALFWVNPPGGVTYAVVGMRPRSAVEVARWDARWLVQQGLLDVLEWLGEKPIPKKPMTGRQLLEHLVRAAAK